MEPAEKKRRGRPPVRFPSPVPSTSGPLTLQDLARSHVAIQKELQIISRAVGIGPPVLTRETAVSRDGNASQEASSVTEQVPLGDTDSDYPPAAQAAGGAVSVADIARKSRNKEKKRPSKPVYSSSSSVHESDSSTSGERSLSSKRRKARRAVSQLLEAAGPVSSKRGKKNFVPCKFIKRGAKFQKVGPGEALWHEYFLALKAMAKSPECPRGWAAHLNKHEDAILHMAGIWDWATCRQWSETVFVKIHDGTLANGWEDQAALKELQGDITAVGKRTFQSRDAPAGRNEAYKMATSLGTVSTNRATQDSSRLSYERDTDGKPCYAWNWGRDCGFQATHGSHPDLKPHICAFCAYRTRKVLTHREMDCVNKQRAAHRAQNSTTGQKDFA